MKEQLRTGFEKWLSSSKFQVAALAIALLYLSIHLLGATADKSMTLIRDVSVAYIGARVLQPLIEGLKEKILR